MCCDVSLVLFLGFGIDIAMCRSFVRCVAMFDTKIRYDRYDRIRFGIDIAMCR
jgi:hypothetical protein